MDIDQITESIRHNAVWVVFVNVLMEQLGLPVPAVPTLMLAGSLMVAPGDAAKLLATLILASVIADCLWYAGGRAYGYRMLAGLCRLSINPASCVSDTEARFVRWGVWSMIVAKFVPGFSIVAPPIAGALRMSLRGFLASVTIGAALWGGTALAAGWMLRTEVSSMLSTVGQHQTAVFASLLLALGAWLAWKYSQRVRFKRLADIPHIAATELLDAMASEFPPLVLDMRGTAKTAGAATVAGAISTNKDELLTVAASWAKTHPIVTLCACPKDAGAIQAARTLIKDGFTSVRPLRGGIEALEAALALRNEIASRSPGPQ
jgi:membrane protein DedA with SNARE-associated domain/rhodanese-related sulfurtransferase